MNNLQQQTMDWKFLLNFYSNILCIFNPRDLLLPEVMETIKKDKYHIYLICKRKKLHFENFTERDGIGYTTLFFLDDKFEKVYLEYQKPTSIFRIIEVRNGLYNIDATNVKDVWLRDFIMINKLNVIIGDHYSISVNEPLPSDLEVMYVGQAFGRTESKTIDYRIVNHDKIQKAALEILDMGTNEEVLIIGIQVKISQLGVSEIAKKYDDDYLIESVKSGKFSALKNKASNQISEGQAISIFEASLIKYFQPELNIVHKDSFPSPGFKSYSEIYHVDFLSTALTIDTRSIEVRIFSKNATVRSYIHMETFPLTNKDVFGM